MHRILRPERSCIKEEGDSDMKKAFKIFSIMFVIEIVLIAILDAMA